MSLYLIAILAPDAVDKQVKEWKNYMLDKFGCRVALKSPAHITLIPPFNLPDDEQHTLKTTLDSFASPYVPFTVMLENFAAFAPRVIYLHVIDNPPMTALKKALETSMMKERYPIKVGQRPFHPHVTIANRDLKKEDFPGAYSHFKPLKYEAHFEVKSVSLLRHNGNTWVHIHDAALHG